MSPLGGEMNISVINIGNRWVLRCGGENYPEIFDSAVEARHFLNKNRRIVVEYFK